MTFLDRLFRLLLPKTRICENCGGFGRINHRCGIVCVDDECPMPPELFVTGACKTLSDMAEGRHEHIVPYRYDHRRRAE